MEWAGGFWRKLGETIDRAGAALARNREDCLGNPSTALKGWKLKSNFLSSGLYLRVFSSTLHCCACHCLLLRRLWHHLLGNVHFSAFCTEILDVIVDLSFTGRIFISQCGL